MTHWCVYVGHWTVLRGGRGASLRTKAVRDGGSKRLAVGTRSVHAETSDEAARLVLQDNFTGAEVDTLQAFRIREVIKGTKVVTIVLTTGVRMIIHRDEEIYAANLIKTTNEETEEAPYI